LTLGVWVAATFAEPEVNSAVEELSDAFELTGDQLLHPASAGAAVTLAECIPRLAIALQLISRGPAAITIECGKIIARVRSGCSNTFEPLSRMKPNACLSRGRATNSLPLPRERQGCLEFGGAQGRR